jgi:5-formyltetrahydrofolate cyclo-ligase
MHELRQQIKTQRNNLDNESQQLAALEIADRISKLRVLKRAKRIAVYNPVRGEVDCGPLINKQILRKKRFFLPVLEKNQLKFAPLRNDTTWSANRFGVLEPVYSAAEIVTARNLDVVIVPLVAFDQQCNRIGMGGGFYDRTFAFIRHRRTWHKPLLIGVAYDFQRVKKLRPELWDVPLDCVVTEKESYGSY